MAQNLISVREERIGVSEGHPQQSFRLARRPVLRDSLLLYIKESDNTEQEWKRQDDFLGSKKGDTHYVLNHNTGDIHFGDGRRGLIPPAGVEIIAREYRYGGGKAGNLVAELIGKPMGHLPGVEKVVNERPAEGGRDEETIGQLKARAPAILRSRNCAFTAKDLEQRAKEAGGVLKARAIPLKHPNHQDIKVPGAVTVAIVPDTEDTKPIPSSDLIRATCNYLERFRPITMELYVTAPHYQHVKLEVLVVAERYASLDAVAEGVTKALNESEHLDPRKQDFGRDIYPSRFYESILKVPDVRSVKKLTIYLDGREWSLNQPIQVPGDGLLYATRHEIVVIRSNE